MFVVAKQKGNTRKETSPQQGATEKLDAHYESFFIGDSLKPSDFLDGFTGHAGLRPPPVSAGAEPGDTRPDGEKQRKEL